MVQTLWKIVWQLLKRLNLELPYHPAIPLLGICPREIKAHVHTKPAGMFRAALLITAPSRNNPNIHQRTSG